MWGGTDSQEVGLEAATLERVRNSSLVECPRADNGSGLKRRAETVDGRLPCPRKGTGTAPVVGERSAAEKVDSGEPLELAEVRMPV